MIKRKDHIKWSFFSDVLKSNFDSLVFTLTGEKVSKKGGYIFAVPIIIYNFYLMI